MTANKQYCSHKPQHGNPEIKPATGRGRTNGIAPICKVTTDRRMGECQREKDAEYIAAANPAVILELIAMARRAEPDPQAES